MTKKEKWLKEAGELFPAAKGSVREVRRGCGYPTCKRCASGEKHHGYLQYGCERPCSSEPSE
jgi:hypothetical protein